MQPSINSEIARIQIEERVAATARLRRPTSPRSARRSPRRQRLLALRSALRPS